jgi:hypothetical protein
MAVSKSLVGALILLSSEHVQAQSISAVQPDDWTDWAEVSISWEHPEPDLENDWIAAFLIDWPATYISWHSLNESTNYQSSDTSGTMSINLLNGRHSYEFRYYRNDDILTTSNIIEPLGKNPMQGHLSLVPGYYDRMMISWVNNVSSNQIVYWGLDPDSLTNSNDVSTDTYSNLDFTNCMGIDPIDPLTTSFNNISEHKIRCDSGCYDDPTSSQLFLDPGYLHSSIMSPLSSGAIIYYQFGNNDDDENGNNLMSEIYSFTAPKVPGDMSSFSFLVTADAGIGAIPLEEQGSATHNDPPINGADEVVKAMINDPLTPNDELLLLNGDISYARVKNPLFFLLFNLLFSSRYIIHLI